MECKSGRKKGERGTEPEDSLFGDGAEEKEENRSKESIQDKEEARIGEREADIAECAGENGPCPLMALSLRYFTGKVGLYLSIYLSNSFSLSLSLSLFLSTFLSPVSFLRLYVYLSLFRFCNIHILLHICMCAYVLASLFTLISTYLCLCRK